MENIGNDIFSPKEPDESGDSESVKKKSKKKKISTKIPLPVEKDISKVEKKVEDKDVSKASDEAGTDTSKDEVNDNDSSGESEQILESNTAYENEYMGELVIDHSNEMIDEKTDQKQEINKDFDSMPEIDVDVLSDNKHDDLDTKDKLESPLMVGSSRSPETYMPWEVSVNPLDIMESMPEETQPEEVKSMPESIVESFDSSLGKNMINPNVESDNYELSKDTPASSNQEYYSEKRGLSRGLTTGLLFGWLIGRRSKEKTKKTKAAEIQSSNIDAQDMLAAKEVLSKRVNILERTQQELQSALDRSLERKDKISAKLTEISSKVTPLKELPKQALYDTKKVGNKKEVSNNIEDYIVEAEDTSSPTKENVRVETSAWHRIEIDNKTGKLAEVPTVEYGEAFIKEQQQEKLARYAANAQTANHLGSTLFSSNSSLNSIEEGNKDVTKKNTYISTDDLVYVAQKIAKNTANPSIWAIALLLVIFIIVTGII